VVWGGKESALERAEEDVDVGAGWAGGVGGRGRPVRAVCAKGSKRDYGPLKRSYPPRGFWGLAPKEGPELSSESDRHRNAKSRAEEDPKNGPK